MDEIRGDIAQKCSVAIDVNAGHCYRAGELGVLEFRIRNEESWRIPALEIAVDCPCQHAARKSARLRNLLSGSEKKQPFRFEPDRAGAALIEIEIVCEGQDGLPRVYRGQTYLNIASKDDVRPPTNISLDVHNLIDSSILQRSDLKGLITIAAGDRDQDRQAEKADRKDPVWVPVDLELDEVETEKRQQALRSLFQVPARSMPARCRQARLESLDPSRPCRIFIYSMPEVRFGRHTQRNDAVLRFLPDFFNDERSRTISSEQFIARYAEGQCRLVLAPGARATLSLNGQVAVQGEALPLVAGSELAIGTQDFGLRVTGSPKVQDAHWDRSADEIRRSDPGDDLFHASPYDYLVFCRTTNGLEEQYVWLLRRIFLGWDEAEAGRLQLGTPAMPRGRLSFWNGRYYLETLDMAAGLDVGIRRLKTGDIACLGQQTEISFGTSRFSWKAL